MSTLDGRRHAVQDRRPADTPLAAPPYRAFGALRAVLALAVLVQHASTEAFGWSWLYGARFGSVAVIVFFALSGFIIAEAAATTYAGRPWAFLANRFMRLVPPFLVFLAMAMLLVAMRPEILAVADWRAAGHLDPFSPLNLLGNLLSIFPFVVFLQPLHPGEQRFEFISVIWAVRLEFAFYLFVFAVLLARRLPRLGRRLPSGRPAALALCTGWLVLHAVFYYGVPLPFGASYYLSFAPAFVFGVALFLAQRGPRGPAAAVAAVALAFTLLHLPHYPSAFAAELLPGGDWLSLDGSGPRLIEIALAAAGMLAMVALAGTRTTGPARRADALLGELSYPIYLAHFPLVLLVASAAWANPWAAFASMAALTMVAVALEVRLVERPLARLRTRVRGRAL